MFVYIAAPLGNPDPAVRAWHRERANLLAALAFAEEGIPVCVHAYAELAIGSGTDHKARERGLKRSLIALETVFRAGGQVWCLLDEYGQMSPGVKAEIAKWDELQARLRSTAKGYHIDRWSEWRTYAEWHAPHLLPEFDRLAVRPTAPPPPQETPPV